MLRKSLILIVSIILSSIQITASELYFTKASVDGIARAYGFVLGQELAIERINKEYPELSVSVVLAKAEFDASFPNIKLKLKDQLVSAMGEKIFDELDMGSKKELQTTLTNQIISREIAQGFLQQVRERSKGKIDSPVIEFLLSVQYLSYPVGEFADGYRQRFTSDGHGKAQGINLVLQLPKSWKAQEGERPHIVQKWVSQNGTGLEMILLDIRDAKGYTPTNTEIEAFVSSGEVKDTILSGSTYLNSSVFSLEMQKGYRLETSMIQERAGMKLYQHMDMYQLFFHGKAIGLMCQSSSSVENKENADESFKKNEPLCQQVLNSLVLMQVYN